MRALFCALSLLLSLSELAAGTQVAVSDPLQRSALMVQDVGQSVMLAVARAGKRLVAVGERGLVLLSDDHGVSWRQAGVPVSVSLTAVSFPTPEQGWVVGHGGVVLHTVDGGVSWSLQLDGKRAAELALEAAQVDIGAEDEGVRERRIRAAKRLLEEGADKPLLAVSFVDARRGVVVGAYGLALTTDDGGQSWRWIGDAIPNPRGMHLYAVAQQGERWYLAGEQGFAARSDDNGETFLRLETPYHGSFFTLDARGEEILLAGLRGNAYRSSDGGEQFEKLVIPLPVSLLASVRLADDSLLLVGQGRSLMRAGAEGFVPQSTPPGPPFNAVVQAQDGTLIAASWRGPVRIDPLQAVSTK